jgi:hypothetical protein
MTPGVRLKLPNSEVMTPGVGRITSDATMISSCDKGTRLVTGILFAAAVSATDGIPTLSSAVASLPGNTGICN